MTREILRKISRRFGHSRSSRSSAALFSAPASCCVFHSAPFILQTDTAGPVVLDKGTFFFQQCEPWYGTPLVTLLWSHSYGNMEQLLWPYHSWQLSYGDSPWFPPATCVLCLHPCMFSPQPSVFATPTLHFCWARSLRYGEGNHPACVHC